MTDTTVWKFGQGDEVKDRVTGFKGIVVARVEWLNRCRRYVLQPTKLKADGERPSEANFDEEQLDLVKAGKVIVEPLIPSSRPPGGPKTGEAVATGRRDVSSTSR